jgi:lipoprotein-anchoring transpeptidase ErfK/SrfK
MARSKRGANWILIGSSVVVLVAIGALAWWATAKRSSAPAEAQAGMATPPTVSSQIKAKELERASRPMPVINWLDPMVEPQEEPAEAEDNESVDEPAKPEPAPPTTVARSELVERGRQAMQRGDWLVARQSLASALKEPLPADQQEAVRRDLLRIADKTIWSREPVPGDPLTEWYKVQSGDNLVRIADRYRVTAALLARVNGMANPNLIRAGQMLKVLKGPLHARVERRAFRLSVFLGDDVLVAEFPVGLGAEYSTPLGTWKVKNKLTNPTYHPPRGGRIIAADNPENPLGEYWIGLEGLSGQAVGQEGFGIHGTIDEDSIGKNVSLGCIRLLNKDIVQLFSMLVEPYSTVEVVD